MNFKHVIKRTKEELKASCLIREKVGIKASYNSLKGKMIIQKLARNGYRETESQKKVLLKKHKYTIDFLNTIFDQDDYNNEYDKFNDTRDLSNCVFVCWRQGYESAPAIVKACISSIKEHLESKYKLILIDKNNFSDYVEIPNYITEKWKKGIITNTHFSDILRTSLLAQHGGMRLDATFFCAGCDVNKYFSYEFWTIRRPDYLHCSPSCGKFATYSLYCNYDSRYIFKIALTLFYKYWDKNNFLIDYLLIEYIFELLYINNNKIKELICKVPNNNSNCDNLLSCIDETYDEVLMENLKKDTCLFKLSWKHNFMANNDTFYSYILSKYGIKLKYESY